MMEPPLKYRRQLSLAKLLKASIADTGQFFLAAAEGVGPRHRIRLRPITIRENKNRPCLLLPNLLPNGSAQGGMETDKERRARRNCQTNWGIKRPAGKRKDDRDRIRKPLLYPAELRDQFKKARLPAGSQA
jgi:hypothetical protein